MVLIVARTDPEVVAAVLPKPLQAPKDAVVSALVAPYPETNVGVDDHEGAVSLGVECEAQAATTRAGQVLTTQRTSSTNRTGSEPPVES